MSPESKPSAFWTAWQGLKGVNFRHLKITDADLRNKWIIITGGNSGIGREAALQFAKWGANIIIACREDSPPHEPRPDVVVQECQTSARAAGHHDLKIEWWPCDMARLSSVQTFGERWLATGLPLDILANNAGIGGRRVISYTDDGFELIHQVNFLSHVWLTMLLLPSIQKAVEPRIICTVSAMQYWGVFDVTNANSGVNSYANNKLYYQTWLTELQNRMLQRTEYKHILIQGIHPGVVKTNIWENSEGKWMQYFGIDAQQGSIAITYAASSPEWGKKGGGNYANRIWQEEPMPQTKNPECRREIWELVGKELKLQERGLDVL